MSETLIKKKSHTGAEVEIVGETYEEGIPEGAGKWRGRISDRGEMLQYIKSSLRYDYDDDPFGSEKRKTPA